MENSDSFVPRVRLYSKKLTGYEAIVNRFPDSRVLIFEEEMIPNWFGAISFVTLNNRILPWFQENIEPDKFGNSRFDVHQVYIILHDEEYLGLVKLYWS